MTNETVAKFFNERKEAWLKKNIKASLSEEEILIKHEECNDIFSLEVWLPNASRRAGQISMATHPCTFSHPSARKNKNDYVTSVIADTEQREDGLLRSGNMEVSSDALGNAAALDVYKFLTLIMPDGKALIEHIKRDSKLAQSLLKIKSKHYEALKEEFLKMIDSSSEEFVTSSKIKQVYFPVEEDYHQLSILTNSGILYYLKKRVNAIRFGKDEEDKEKLKGLRALRKDNDFSEEGFSEIYNLTTIGYGGTKPQNISVLNSQNGGQAHLLHSMPPELKRRETNFPRKNFFNESINIWHLKDTFQALYNIFKVPNYTNEAMRSARKYHYEQLIEKVIEQMWAVRLVSTEQYYEKTSLLKSHQKVWLYMDDIEKREESDDWLDKIIEELSSWILQSYKKSLGSLAIEINGTWEYLDIKDIVIKHKEALR